jgi:hypothetical protein
MTTMFDRTAMSQCPAPLVIAGPVVCGPTA